MTLSRFVRTPLTRTPLSATSPAASHIPVIDVAIDTATTPLCAPRSDKVHSVGLASSLKTRLSRRRFARSEPTERSPNIRAQTAEIPKDPSSTLRRCQRLGVEKRTGASPAGSWWWRGMEKRGDRAGGRSFELLQSVHLPYPIRAGMAGWVDGWHRLLELINTWNTARYRPAISGVPARPEMKALKIYSR